jgi:phenylacetate-CoA ligase
MEFAEMLRGIYEAKSVLKAKPEKVESLAQKRLHFILSLAYQKIPFYSKIFRSRGITPDDIKNADDLALLPVLRRRDLIENQKEMLNTDFRPDECFVKTTSGSTGEPVVLLFDPDDWYRYEGIALRGQLQGGLRFRHKVAVVGTPATLAQNQFYRMLSQLGRLRYGSVADDVGVVLSSLRNFRPHVLKTLPSFLRVATEKGANFRCPLVFSMSEVLDQSLRKEVESDLGASIINLYGSIEFRSIAWECSYSSLYHLDADAVVVEAVKFDSDSPANPGEPARILVTGLLSRAMPLIRYELGDMVVLSDDECSCGVELPLIERIEGRQLDCIRLPSGRLISPYVLSEWVKELGAIKQYQVIQQERDRISVKIVPVRAFDEELIHRWSSRLGEIVGEEVTVEPVVVSSIPIERPGKYKYVMSRVS